MSQIPAAEGHPDASSWTTEQLTALAEQWRRLQRDYAFHPFVNISPLQGEPPVVYQVDYRIRTLEINSAGELGYAPSCSVIVTILADFPASPPHIRPLQAIFHPNVDSESVQIVPEWDSSAPLTEVIERVGRLLAFQMYDAGNIWNPTAMEWVTAHGEYLPTEPGANFSSEAGGSPSNRIALGAPALLSKIQLQLQTLGQHMLDGSASQMSESPAQVTEVIRSQLSALVAGDLPPEISRQANALDQWSAAIPASAGCFAIARQWRAAAKTSAAATTALAKAVEDLSGQHHELKQRSAGHPGSNADEIVSQLPTTSDVQKAHGSLRAVLVKAEQRIQAARTALQSLELPASAKALPAGIRELLDSEHKRQEPILAVARNELTAALESAEPAIASARADARALESLVQWRDLVDTTARTDELYDLIMQWTASGVQAYFMSYDSGTHGPFDFEQTVDVGTTQIAVRKISAHAIEAIDLVQGVSIGQSRRGDLRASIRGSDSGGAFAATFSPTPRCDDLALQLNYAVAHTRELLRQLRNVGDADPNSSWPRTFAHALGQPSAIEAISATHAQTVARWSGLAEDLRALGPFKERMATFHLLTRAMELLPSYQRDLQIAMKAQEKATARLTEIISRSSVDGESGRPVISSKFHKEYESLLLDGEQQQQNILRLGAAIKQLTSQVKARLAVQRGAASPIGSAKPIQLTTLPPMAGDMHELSAAMSDTAVLERVTAIEQMVNTQLYFGRRPAAMTNETAVSPATETISTPSTESSLQLQTTTEDQRLADPVAEVAATESELPVMDAEQENGADFAVEGSQGYIEAEADDDVLSDWPT
jgi:hypothetical protein